jgi:hypothetical protein
VQADRFGNNEKLGAEQKAPKAAQNGSSLPQYFIRCPGIMTDDMLFDEKIFSDDRQLDHVEARFLKFLHCLFRVTVIFIDCDEPLTVDPKVYD